VWKSAWALASPPVGATGESQGRNRRESEGDATHQLHGSSPSVGSGGPLVGDTPGLSVDPYLGDKPAHRATAFGLDAFPAPSKLCSERA